MYLIAFVWCMLAVVLTSLWWSRRRLRGAGDQHVCRACGYQRSGLRISGSCPECGGSTWVRGHERHVGAKRAQRVAIALLPVVIGMCATGSVSLVMQRSSLKHVVVIVGVTHAVLMIVLCARYRYHLASPLLAWSAGTGVVLSVLQCVVAWGYWRMGPGPDDFGWPLTDFVLISLVCFVLSLIASVLIWGITAPAGAYVAQGDEPRDSSRAST